MGEAGDRQLPQVHVATHQREVRRQIPGRRIQFLPGDSTVRPEKDTSTLTYTSQERSEQAMSPVPRAFTRFRHFGRFNLLFLKSMYARILAWGNV